ncbi:membrane protein [Staphylococcus aureus]|nr:membrane protein [Staphylococcus aureus]
MNKDTMLDKGYVIATILNVFFLLGLIFISSFGKFIYINSVCYFDGNKCYYLVVKVMNFKKNN